jgi:hypothetical protein
MKVPKQMKKSISIAPPNSLIVVMDRSVAEVPKSMNNQLISATPTCIAIGTLAAADGKTKIVLTDENTVDSSVLTRVFEGVLTTPSLKLSVYSTLGAVLLELEVSTAQTHLEIWANDKMEPDDIQIVILDRPSRSRKTKVH